MKKSIALLAICVTAHAAFADVVSLAPGQQVVVPASQPGSVPVVIEAGLLKQTSQLSWLPAYECQNLTAAQLKDPNDAGNDPNTCLVGGIYLLNWTDTGSQVATSVAKPTTQRRTYGYETYNGQTYPWPFRHDFTSTWSGIKVDLQTGRPTEVTASIEYTIQANGKPYYFSGGFYNEKNLRLVAADLKIYSDVNGTNTANKNYPSVNYKQVYAPTWAFDSWVGPALPINRLAFTSSELERTKILTEAGFKVTSIGDGILYAVGSYKTVNLVMTTAGRDLLGNSLGWFKQQRNIIRAISGDDYNPMSFSASIGYFIN
jgi:hypothetical protein